MDESKVLLVKDLSVCQRQQEGWEAHAHHCQHTRTPQFQFSKTVNYCVKHFETSFFLKIFLGLLILSGAFFFSFLFSLSLPHSLTLSFSDRYQEDMGCQSSSTNTVPNAHSLSDHVMPEMSDHTKQMIRESWLAFVEKNTSDPQKQYGPLIFFRSVDRLNVSDFFLLSCCFTSTETIRLIRDGSPGRSPPPRLSRSSSCALCIRHSLLPW